jgi:anthranilate synthase component 1
MLKELSLEDFLQLAQSNERVVVFREILADRVTPISIMESLAEEMKDGAVLESASQRHNTGRYSFIAFDLEGKLTVKDHQVEEHLGDQITKPQGDPLNILRDLKNTLQCGIRKDMAGKVTSSMGFMTYDAIRLFENIPDQHAKDPQLPEVLFNFYRNTLMFDHQEQKLLITQVTEVGANAEMSYQNAIEKINTLAQKISRLSAQSIQTISTQTNKQNDVDIDIADPEFMSMVERAKQYIVDGDAFQIVISRSFQKKYTVSPLNIYRSLRVLSPTPYMFYIPVEGGVIIGASPEKLIGVHEGEVTINPIAGTRRRAADLDDKAIEADMLSDPKEIAEHTMLVDLARNDLGAVCEPGTVHPFELMVVRHFSHVSHIASVVKGKLAKDKDAFDALRYAFPAGTLSGAPKIRAMQIIDELEVSRRNLYGGAICRLDSAGNLDTCIAIRMAMLKEGIATVRAGAGIVYDSDPQAEANETRQKAQAVLEAIALAEGGLQ